LLVFGAKPIEAPDNLVSFTAAAAMRFDGLDEVGCSAIVKKENALPDAPERRRAELIRPRGTLRDTVCKTLAHTVQEKIGK
jgi:hypothetical protein